MCAVKQQDTSFTVIFHDYGSELPDICEYRAIANPFTNRQKFQKLGKRQKLFIKT